MNDLAMPAPTTTARERGRITAAHISPDMNDHIHALLVRLLPHPRPDELRQDRRSPYPFLFQLVPVAEDNTTPLQTPITVVGKNVSDRGIGFFHQQPLPFRRTIVTLGDPGGYSLSLLAELLWCRFTRHGWYDSGGRFLEIISRT